MPKKISHSYSHHIENGGYEFSYVEQEDGTCVLSMTFSHCGNMITSSMTLPDQEIGGIFIRDFMQDLVFKKSMSVKEDQF